MKPKFKTQLVKLTEKNIAEQLKYVAMYQKLLEREIQYKDLANLENIKKYSDSIASHMQLVVNPYIEMPIISY
jgi:hypothetical protein